MPCISRPKATLSRTLRHGKRLRLCHTMTEPAPGARGSRGRAGSTMRTLPLVAGSSPPTICKSVLLPQPLGPSRHEKRREAKRCVKRSSATMSAPPRPGQTCVTSSTMTSMPLARNAATAARHWRHNATRTAGEKIGAGMFDFFPGHYRWSYNTLLAFSAGGQLGDFALIEKALREKVGQDDAWHREWARLAAILERRAKQGSRLSAAENYFLASLYHTIGEHFIPPASPERLASYKEVLRTFDLGREASHHPVERVLVPFEGSTLPAYFVPGLGQGPRPAAIFICGLDTTKELWFLRARLEFAERGISALFIDTPGIGEALRLQKLVTRADYEQPVG